MCNVFGAASLKDRKDMEKCSLSKVDCKHRRLIFPFQALENDRETHFEGRFQLYNFLRQNLQERIKLSKAIKDKPDILEVILIIYEGGFTKLQEGPIKGSECQVSRSTSAKHALLCHA